MRRGRLRTRRSGSSAATPAPTPGRTSPRPGRIIGTSRTRLETAAAFGLRVDPTVGDDPALAMAIDFRSLPPEQLRCPPQSLAAAHLRGQQPEPEHGPAGPLSVRPGARGHGQAALRPRPFTSPRRHLTPAARPAPLVGVVLRAGPEARRQPIWYTPRPRDTADASFSAGVADTGPPLIADGRARSLGYGASITEGHDDVRHPRRKFLRHTTRQAENFALRIESRSHDPNVSDY
jgi:hypothetical protein